MKIDRNSYGTVVMFYITCAAICFCLLHFVDCPLFTWPMSAVLLWICIWQTSFFHVPERQSEGSDKKICSVCDGRVVICEKAFESEVLQRECIQVSVYMNFFDVHANFWPVSGEVTYFKYHPGKHLLAFKPKASLENEHTCTVIKAGEHEVLFKQIAGGFARRIRNYATPGLNTVAGKQCGIIKFGSRIDIFLPLDTRIDVKLGDYVRNCETILAELS